MMLRSWCNIRYDLPGGSEEKTKYESLCPTRELNSGSPERQAYLAANNSLLYNHFITHDVYYVLSNKQLTNVKAFTLSCSVGDPATVGGSNDSPVIWRKKIEDARKMLRNAAFWNFQEMSNSGKQKTGRRDSCTGSEDSGGVSGVSEIPSVLRFEIIIFRTTVSNLTTSSPVLSSAAWSVFLTTWCWPHGRAACWSSNLRPPMLQRFAGLCWRSFMARRHVTGLLQHFGTLATLDNAGQKVKWCNLCPANHSDMLRRQCNSLSRGERWKPDRLGTVQ